MSPRRYAPHETGKAIALGYWSSWSSKAHDSESEQEFAEAIETAATVLRWAEEHL